MSRSRDRLRRVYKLEDQEVDQLVLSNCKMELTNAVFIHEEAQQAIEYKSAVAIATPEVPCVVALVGDWNQAPGGVDSQNKAA